MESLATSLPNSGEPRRGGAALADWLRRWPAGPAPGDRAFGAPVTDRRSSWVRRCQIDSSVYFVKTYDYPSLGDRLRGLGRWTGPLAASRAVREFDALAWLHRAGLGPPLAVGALEWRRRGLLRRAVLIAAAAPGTDCAALLPQLAPAARAALARAIGGFVQRAHAAGFRDGNLDLRNLIAAPAPPGGFAVAKIDSPRFRLARSGRSDRWTRADWARLLPQLAAFGLDAAARAGAAAAD